MSGTLVCQLLLLDSGMWESGTVVLDVQALAGSGLIVATIISLPIWLSLRLLERKRGFRWTWWNGSVAGFLVGLIASVGLSAWVILTPFRI